METGGSFGWKVVVLVALLTAGMGGVLNAEATDCALAITDWEEYCCVEKVDEWSGTVKCTLTGVASNENKRSEFEAEWTVGDPFAKEAEREESYEEDKEELYLDLGLESGTTADEYTANVTFKGYYKEKTTDNLVCEASKQVDVTVVDVGFHDAGSCLRKYGWDQKSFEEGVEDQYWISVQHSTEQVDNTFVKVITEPHDAYDEIEFISPAISSIDTTAPSSWVDHICISGDNTGEGILKANLKDYGCTCGEFGVASYDLLEKDTRYFVISSDDSNPNPPSNPNSSINDVWIQAVAESSVKSSCSTNINYDIGSTGVGQMSWEEYELFIVKFMQQYTGSNSPGNDGVDGAIWVVFVEDLEPGGPIGATTVGFHDPNRPGICVVSDHAQKGLITAHEWGHAIGCDHVEIEGSVMYENVSHIGDFVPKENWDEVSR